MRDSISTWRVPKRFLPISYAEKHRHDFCWCGSDVDQGCGIGELNVRSLLEHGQCFINHSTGKTYCSLECLLKDLGIELVEWLDDYTYHCSGYDPKYQPNYTPQVEDDDVEDDE